jgi:hypothetical protein
VEIIRNLFNGEVWCFLCGKNWILKYYLYVLRLQRVKDDMSISDFEWEGDYWIMNWKLYARKLSWPTWTYYSGVCLRGLRKTKKILNQDSQYPWWDSALTSCRAGYTNKELVPLKLKKKYTSISYMLQYPSVIRKYFGGGGGCRGVITHS